MSTYYLIDPFTGGNIIDIVSSETGQIDATGFLVVRVSDGIKIQGNPTNLTDLLTAKYAGLLAYYAGFTNIIADPCLDPTNIDWVNSLGLMVGNGYVNHCVAPGVWLGGQYTSVPMALGSTPTQCVIVWEEFSFLNSDNKDQRFQRTYVEESGVISSCQMSFNGGSTYNTIQNGVVFDITGPDQGSSFSISLIKLSAPPFQRIYLGSWALIF